MNKLLLYAVCLLVPAWVMAQQNKPVPKTGKFRFIATAEEPPPKRDSLLVSEPFDRDRILLEEPQKEEFVGTTVEQMPEFPGGYVALQRYISTNLHYPERALKRNITGRVFVSFVVGTDGSIKDVSIAKRIDPECDAEAIRLITSMPAWKPGRQNGRPVSIRYSIPISFYPPEKK